MNIAKYDQIVGSKSMQVVRCSLPGMHARTAGVSPRGQRGAVLFIALMLLIILTLLGISSAQVVALQERMAAIYRADAVALQNAEDLLAGAEREMTRIAAASNVLCENLYQGGRKPAGWVSDGGNAGYHVENLGRGASFISAIGSLEAGMASEMADKNCLMLQISAHAYDVSDPDDATSHGVVQSIFTP